MFDGPTPIIRIFDNRLDEISELRQWLSDIESKGVSPAEIAVLVRDESVLEKFSDFTAEVMSMHDAKGAEFRAVAVPYLDQDILPAEKRLLAAKDEAELDEVMMTERHLLYVAATRARDFLWLSGVEPVSEFLTDLAASEISSR